MFGQIASKLGGKVVLILSGAAPLDDEVLHFLRAVFSCMAMQAYGDAKVSGEVKD